MVADDLSAFLHELARAHPDHLAVAGERSALTFSELDAAAAAWARSFGAAGVGPGLHVGLLAGNGAAWLAVAFGVWRAGATLVPISTFVTAPELATLLAHADVDTLVLQPRLRGHDYSEHLRRLPAPQQPRRVIVLDSHLPADDVEAHAALTPPAPDAVACILYTSGTSGQPKGVMLSHRAILSTVWPTAARCGLTAADALLSTLPLFWVAGLVIRALPTLAAGCALILTETFTIDALMTLLRRHQPTALHLRPPQVGQLLAQPGFDPKLLAAVRRGGGRVEWYAPHLDAERTRLITGYGMTETAGYVTALDWRDPAEVRRTQLGAPLPGVEIRIVGDSEQRCAAGQEGEIRVRGPGLFSGYYKQPPRTGLDADGFFITGDRGRIDTDGVFHFVGRSKDLLRVKGINVSPLEVEAVLAAHADVEAAYVVGLPPDALDQTVVALIVAKPACQPTEAALRALADTALSHYKRPQRYVFIARGDVPLGGTAKPQRAALAELARGKGPES